MQDEPLDYEQLVSHERVLQDVDVKKRIAYSFNLNSPHLFGYSLGLSVALKNSSKQVDELRCSDMPLSSLVMYLSLRDYVDNLHLLDEEYRRVLDQIGSKSIEDLTNEHTAITRFEPGFSQFLTERLGPGWSLERQEWYLQYMLFYDCLDAQEANQLARLN